MILKAEAPRLNYDYERQEWQLFTPVVMAPAQLAHAVNFCREQYRKRIAGEAMPAKRKRMTEAVQKLTPAAVKQYVIGKSEKILYHDGKL